MRVAEPTLWLKPRGWGTHIKGRHPHFFGILLVSGWRHFGTRDGRGAQDFVVHHSGLIQVEKAFPVFSWLLRRRDGLLRIG